MRALPSPAGLVERPQIDRLAMILGGGGLLLGLVTGAIRAEPLLDQTCVWVLIAVTIPLIIAVSKQLASPRVPRARAVALHILVFAGLVLFHTVSFNVLRITLTAASTVHWVKEALSFARYDALMYPLVMVAALMVRQQRMTRRSELAAARMARRAAEAEVEHVRVRLDPDEVLLQLADVESDLELDPSRAESRLHEISRSLRRKLERIGSSIPPPLVPMRRSAALDVPRDPRVDVFLLSALFGVYLVGLNILWRAVRGVAGWHDLPGTFLAFIAVGVCAAAGTPLFRRSLTWFQRSRSGALMAVVQLLGFCALQALLVELLMGTMRRYGFGRPQAATFDFALILIAVSFVIVATADLKRRQREWRIRTESLAAAVAEARLRSLRTQLAPHFLFNTLNSVMSMLPQDAVGARLMLSRLRSLLRAVTDHHDRQEVALADDLDMTRSYLEIERVRFRDAVDVIVDVDERLLDAYVPAFLLQPLVENAIRHGALATLDRGTVHIAVSSEGGSLVIVVRNDGELLDPSGWQVGIGLSTTRARLAQIYGADHELAIECGETVVSVRIRLPLRRAPRSREG